MRPPRGDLDRVEYRGRCDLPRPRAIRSGDLWCCTASDWRRKRSASAPRNVRSNADKSYRAFAKASGGLTLGLMALIGLFLLIRSWSALRSRASASSLARRGSRVRAPSVCGRRLLGTFLIAIIALADRGAGRDLLRVVRDRIRTGLAAAPAHVVHRRARRDTEPDLRPLGPRLSPAPGDPAQPLAGHAPRLHPVLPHEEPAQHRRVIRRRRSSPVWSWRS